MPRIRSIKPEFWSDYKLAEDLTREQRLFYIGLWNEADDEGRFIAHPRRLLGAVFPYDRDLDEPFIEDSLRTLAESGRLHLYMVDGEPYGQLTKFAAHQKINRPTPSRIPAPTTTCEASLNAHGGLTEGSLRARKELGARSRELGTRKGKQLPRAHEAPVEPNGDDQRAACVEFVRSAGYGAREKLLAEGEDSTAWQGPTGDPVPWEDRLRLLKLAHARVEDGQSDNLRSALRYVVPQQLDPFSPKSAKNGTPGSEESGDYDISWAEDLR